MDKKSCTNCKKIKPLDDFYFNKTKKIFWNRCKECVRNKQKLDRHVNIKRLNPVVSGHNADAKYLTWVGGN